MTSRFLLSSSEHKILFAIGFLLCGFYLTNVSDRIVATYNEGIRNQQIEKERLANNEPSFSFDVCVFRSTPFYETILAFQFLTIPLLLFSLKKQHFKRFIFSQALTTFILFGYLGWMLETFDLINSDVSLDEENILFNNYILYQSTFLDFIQFSMLAVLLVIQSTFLIRFVVEKFQAKLS